MRKIIVLLLLPLTSYLFVNSSNAQIISTVVGNGVLGFSGDGGPDTAAELHSPEGIRLDDSGNIYFADAGSNRIRKVIASTGIISTVAGGGTGLGYGDGGPATDAALDLPTDIAIDDSGNIYIADMEDYVIRKVTTSTGIITSIVGIPGSLNFGYAGDGGQAATAVLDYPDGLALDDSGNIYIADYFNNAIRKVTISTGIITTVAGNGYGHFVTGGGYQGGYTGNGGPATTAELHGPTGVALDDSGNIYISDIWNNCIRKVIASTGIITTVAGRHTGGYSGDGGPARLAELSEPVGVSVDKYGNIYIGDYNNNRIRKVTYSTGIINTIAGIDTFGYSGDGGLASAAELSAPYGLTVDKLASVYISDAGNNRIRKVTYDTNTVTVTNQLKVESEKVKVFPNPSNGKFVLSLSNINQNYSIEIFNYLSEEVFSQFNIQHPTFDIDISSQPNGVYLYRVLKETGELVGEGKVVVER